MKKKFRINWFCLWLGISFVFHLLAYLNEKTTGNLVMCIVYAVCFAAYSIVLIIANSLEDRHLLIVYDDFFELDGKNIFSASFVGARKNVRYIKYGLKNQTEKRYVFTQGDLRIEYGVFEIDEHRKLLVIYRIHCDESFFHKFSIACEHAKVHYTQTHDVPPLDQNEVYYKNKRNALVIREFEGRIRVEHHRYCIPMEIHSKLQLRTLDASWAYLCSNEDDGRYFSTRSAAEDYVKMQLGVSDNINEPLFEE